MTAVVRTLDDLYRLLQSTAEQAPESHAALDARIGPAPQPGMTLAERESEWWRRAWADQKRGAR